MAIHFVNISESEFLSKKLLYKYMPLELALASIHDKYLWFTNPIVWKDPFEKRFIEGRYLIQGKQVQYPLNGKVFCSCFTQTTTSEAYWNAYPDGQLGISFKFRRDRLLDVLNAQNDYDIYIGKVNYLRTNQITRKLSDIECLNQNSQIDFNNRELHIRLLLLKRIAFEYENEIRVIVIKKDRTKEKGIKLNYQTEPVDLIDTITIDPSVQRYTENMLKTFIKDKYGFKKVYKSQIYSMKNDILIEI